MDVLEDDKLARSEGIEPARDVEGEPVLEEGGELVRSEEIEAAGNVEGEPALEDGGELAHAQEIDATPNVEGEPVLGDRELVPREIESTRDILGAAAQVEDDDYGESLHRLLSEVVEGEPALEEGGELVHSEEIEAARNVEGEPALEDGGELAHSHEIEAAPNVEGEPVLGDGELVLREIESTRDILGAAAQLEDDDGESLYRLLSEGEGEERAPKIDRPCRDMEPFLNLGRNKHAFSFFMAAFISILLGYGIGVTSNAEIFLNDQYDLLERKFEFVMATTKLMAVLGSVMAAWICHRYGRRATMWLLAVFFFLGYFIMCLPIGFDNLIFVGLFIINIGVGHTLLIVPLYVAEISPASFRGSRSSLLPEMFLNIGTLFSHVAYYVLSKIKVDLANEIILGTAAILLALLIIGTIFLPESPRWLIMQGLGDAKHIVAKISDSEMEAGLIANLKEVAGIPQECDEDNEDNVQVTKGGGWLDLFKTRPVRHMLYLSAGMYLVQQVSGGETLFLYSPKIFEVVTSSHNLKLLLSMAVDFTKIIFMIIPILLLDQLGRRQLLLFSMGGLIVSLVSLGTCLTIVELSNGNVEWASYMCMVSLLFYAAFYSIGMGPIPAVYSSEIFLLRLRSHGCAIGVAVSQVASGALSMQFIPLYKAITFGGVAFSFAGIAMVAWAVFYVYMPETRGRRMEDMGYLFGSGRNWRSAARLAAARGKQHDVP